MWIKRGTLPAAALAVALIAGSATAQQSESELLAKVRAWREQDSAQAVEVLAELVDSRRPLAVRVAAAEALGDVGSPTTGARLHRLIRRGGPDAVRDALARSAARVPDSRRYWELALRRAEGDELGRVQLVRQLALWTDSESRDLLIDLLDHDSDLVSATALRALGERPDAGAFLPTLVADRVVSDGIDTRTQALELAFRFGADDLTDVLRRVEPREGDPRLVRTLIEDLQTRATYLHELAEYERRRGTDYALPTKPQEPLRETTGRQDLVFVFDCTASESKSIRRARARIEARADQLAGTGIDLRLAVVGYRDVLKDANQRRTSWTVRAHPLTRDAGALVAWTHDLQAAGVGESAAATSEGLRVALEELDYRPNAVRLVEFLPATKLDRPKQMATLVEQHRRAHRVRVRLHLPERREPTRCQELLLRATGERLRHW